MRQKFTNPDQHRPELKLFRTPRLTVKKLSRRLSVSTEAYLRSDIWAISLLGEKVDARFNVSRTRMTTHVLVLASIFEGTWVRSGEGSAVRGVVAQLRIWQLTLGVRFGLLTSTEQNPGGRNDSPSQVEGYEPNLD